MSALWTSDETMARCRDWLRHLRSGTISLVPEHEILEDALELVDIADAGTIRAGQRARVDLLRAQIAFASRRGDDAPLLLLSAARELERTDPKIARATYLDAFSAARPRAPASRIKRIKTVST